MQCTVCLHWCTVLHPMHAQGTQTFIQWNKYEIRNPGLQFLCVTYSKLSKVGVLVLVFFFQFMPSHDYG